MPHKDITTLSVCSVRHAGMGASTGGMRLREFMPAAADQARQRSTSSFGAAHLISRLRTVLRLGRQVCLILFDCLRRVASQPLLCIAPVDGGSK